MARKSKVDPITKVKNVEQYLNEEIGIKQAGKLVGIHYTSVSKWIRI